jgi:hypothetical protein
LSTKLIPISWRELIKKLTAIGFTGPYPGTKHHHMVKDGVFFMIPNPHHGEKISVKLQQIILKETGIRRDEWLSDPIFQHRHAVGPTRPCPTGCSRTARRARAGATRMLCTPAQKAASPNISSWPSGCRPFPDIFPSAFISGMVQKTGYRQGE